MGIWGAFKFLSLYFFYGKILRSKSWNCFASKHRLLVKNTNIFHTINAMIVWLLSLLVVYWDHWKIADTRVAQLENVRPLRSLETITRMCKIRFLQRKSWRLATWSAGAWSWWKHILKAHLLQSWNKLLFHATVSVVLSVTYWVRIMPSLSKNMVTIISAALAVMQSFFNGGELVCFHYMLCNLVSGLKIIIHYGTGWRLVIIIFQDCLAHYHMCVHWSTFVDPSVGNFSHFHDRFYRNVDFATTLSSSQLAVLHN